MVAMDVTSLQAYCLTKPGAWPDNPWDHEHPVIKVGPGERGKIFAFLGAAKVGLKCGPSREIADEWLLRYPDDVTVTGYIGRSGWNDLAWGRSIPDEGSWRRSTSRTPRSSRSSRRSSVRRAGTPEPGMPGLNEADL